MSTRRGHADVALVALADVDTDLPRQRGHRPGKLLGRRLAALFQQPEGGFLGVAHPPCWLVDAQHRRELLVPTSFDAGNAERGGGLQDRRLVGRHHEHRAAHREHAEELPLSYSARSTRSSDGSVTRAQAERYTVAGSVACRQTMPRAASTALEARCSGERWCRTPTRARRSAVVDPFHGRPVSRRWRMQRHRNRPARGVVASVTAAARRWHPRDVRLGCSAMSLPPSHHPRLSTVDAGIAVLAAEDVRGYDVSDFDNRSLGRVEDLVIDQMPAASDS